MFSIIFLYTETINGIRQEFQVSTKMPSV